MEINWIWIWFIPVFFLGASVGSFLNVVVARIPTERSIFWPSSHCFNCFRPIAWYYNLPILGYLLLRGKCASCGKGYSSRYLWVELFTGVLFVLLFAMEIVWDIRGIGWIKQYPVEMKFGLVPIRGWLVFATIACAVCFLLAASLCDIEHLEIPLPITMTGTLVGLVISTFLAWPFPHEPGMIPQPAAWTDIIRRPLIPTGIVPWPFWFPVPWGLTPGGPFVGFLDGLFGAIVGALICRVVRWVYTLGRGIESMGVGDSDLMMMAGAFLGWQVVLVGFFVAVFPGILVGVIQLFLKGSQVLPFGPSLALGCLLSFYGWPWIGPVLAPLFFEPFLMGVMAVSSVIVLGASSLIFRLLGGPQTSEE